MLPAFPTESALAPSIEPSRFRSKPLPLFTLTHGKTVARNVTVFRLPSAWTPEFEKWDNLPDRFDGFKTVLEGSPKLRVRGAGNFDPFAGRNYDNATQDERVVLPKASLLNLFGKMTELREPIKKRKPWFGFVLRVLEIGRERLIAVVDPEMPDRIREIRENIDEHSEVYEKAPVGDHHKNMPAAFGVTKSSMFSVKTTDHNGNLQLTVGRGTDPETGRTAWILDADIDESGELLAHLGDLFKHRFTGGTHPVDIHEYLQLTFPGIDLGYRLL
jgi:hypothetical protein